MTIVPPKHDWTRRPERVAEETAAWGITYTDAANRRARSAAGDELDVKVSPKTSRCQESHAEDDA
jgi:hypothetical protein